jgi:molybdopterin adenylyltransferase
MPRTEPGNPAIEHRERARVRALAAVITLSTTRVPEDDVSGDTIQQLLESRGHAVTFRKIIPDRRTALRTALRRLLHRSDVSVIVTTGGTGLAASDITVETVRPMLEKELTGFNALFMQLSYSEVGSACMLSRTLAGTLQGRPIFCLPGSPKACRLAMESLILPELSHILLIAGSR